MEGVWRQQHYSSPDLQWHRAAGRASRWGRAGRHLGVDGLGHGVGLGATWELAGLGSRSGSHDTRCTARGKGTITSSPLAALSAGKSARTFSSMTACNTLNEESAQSL